MSTNPSAPPVAGPSDSGSSSTNLTKFKGTSNTLHSIIRSHPEQYPQVFVNAVYYSNYKFYKGETPRSLNLALISHVFYSSAWIKEDGEVYLSNPWVDSEVEVDGTNGCLGSFALIKARYPHLKVLLSVGGGGNGSLFFSSVAASNVKRQQFASSCRLLVERYGLDGIDIDWEYPSSIEEGINLITLLATIRQQLPSPKNLLTAVLACGPSALQYINFVLVEPYLDYINMMGYNFAGPWQDLTNHQAQLYSPLFPTTEAARHSAHLGVSYCTNAGLPSYKILLGIPTYGRSYLHANNIGQMYSGTGGENGIFQYKNLPRPDAVEYVDENVVAAYCIGADGGFVSYDNHVTVRTKTEYAKNACLGGMFFSCGTSDVHSGERSLIQTSFVVLHSEYQ